VSPSCSSATSSSRPCCPAQSQSGNASPHSSLTFFCRWQFGAFVGVGYGRVFSPCDREVARVG
jgi:hypothetical protein